jgi:hypothetical protein
MGIDDLEKNNKGLNLTVKYTTYNNYKSKYNSFLKM